MPRSTGILSLGTRKDATTWENGCKKLGFTAPSPIKKPYPSLDELNAFFKTKPHWIFFAGHFGGRQLLNEKEDVHVTFGVDHVIVYSKGKKATLRKGRAEFQVHTNCQVVLWGGCNVCDGTNTIRVLRRLFGNHLLLGFAGLTGWRMVDAMLGGGFIKSPHHFFDRVRGKDANLISVRNAWLRTARYGYGGGRFEDRFRAIDPNGQEWKIHNKKIVRGRKIT